MNGENCKMKLKDIHIRDPFILVHNKKYFMYGSRGMEAFGKCTGLDVYISDDLAEWSSPVVVFNKPESFWADMHFWAPEVHKYHDKFYMFVSFKSASQCRGTQILVSDDPSGPFYIHSEEPVTPRDWECLDGTLYIEKDGTPYMVFCHEWLQVKNGEMCAVELSFDLKRAVGRPFLLFKASEPVWAKKGTEEFVTDGPFMYRLSSGELLMIWSSVSESGYVEAVSYSSNGSINGKWIHKKELLFDKDGGHGMIFSSKDGETMFVAHSPNNSPDERPFIKSIYEKDGVLYAV